MHRMTGLLKGGCWIDAGTSPKVKLIPGSVEQRGTDLKKALTGEDTFRRFVSHSMENKCNTSALAVFVTSHEEECLISLPG